MGNVCWGFHAYNILIYTYILYRYIHIYYIYIFTASSKSSFDSPVGGHLSPEIQTRSLWRTRIRYILFVPLWTPLSNSKLIQSWCPKVQDEPLAQWDTIYWVLLSSAAFGGGMGKVTHRSIGWYHGKLIHFNGIYQDFHGGFSWANCFLFREGVIIRWGPMSPWSLVKQVPRWPF